MGLRHDARTLRREEEDRRLHAFLDHATPAEKMAFNNTILWALIQAELVEPPDQEHPHATIAQLKQSHPDEIRAISALVKSRQFHAQHRETLVALYRPLLKRAALIK